jgi:uncharacterized protein (DUF2342 family)
MTADDEMVEAAARAIYDFLEGPVADQDFCRQQRQWETAKSLARAAISAIAPMIREECAKVADESAEVSDWVDGRIEARNIATAIRAMTDQK